MRRLSNEVIRLANSDEVYHARPLIFAFSLCFGAVVYLSLRFEPSAPVLLIIFLAAAALMRFASPRTGALGGISFIVLFGLASGLAAGKLRTSKIGPGFQTVNAESLMIEGWVTAIEPASSSGVRLRIMTHAVEGMENERRPRQIRLTHRASLKVAPGRFVRCLAVLRPPPGPSVPGDYNFQRQAWFQGLHAVGYVQGRCRGGVLGTASNGSVSRAAYIAAKRRQLAEFVFHQAGTRAGGFAAALASGDRSFMREEDRDALRRAGLAHLLAISGLHIGIVCGLVYLLVFRGLARIEWLALRMPLQKPAAICALIIGCAYLVLSGASVSTQRAFVMAALVFTAVLIDRRAISLRTFALAMILVIVLQPNSVLSPGFQMSFAATGMLIAVYEAWRDKRLGTPQGFGSRQMFALKSLFVTSLAAGIATAPYAFFHFDRIAPFGLIANFLAMPIVTFVTAPAAALSLILTPFGLAEYGLRIFGWSLELVLGVAHWSADLNAGSGPQWKPMPSAALLIFSMAIAMFILLRRKFRVYSASGLAISGFLMWALHQPASIFWAPSGEVIARFDGQYQKIAFAKGEGLSPLSYKDLKTGAYCQNRRCLIELEHGRAFLIDGDHEIDCGDIKADMIVLENRMAVSTCENSLTFQNIQTNGGAAIWPRRSGIEIKFANTCGNRPWQSACDN